MTLALHDFLGLRLLRKKGFCDNPLGLPEVRAHLPIDKTNFFDRHILKLQRDEIICCFQHPASYIIESINHFFLVHPSCMNTFDHK